MKTLYSQIRKISKPIVQCYDTDITKHDKINLDKSVPGELRFWQPNENGSHMVVVKHHTDCHSIETIKKTRWQYQWFLGVEQYNKGNQWYMLESLSKPKHGHVTKITFDEAKAIIEQYLLSIKARCVIKDATEFLTAV